jgi:hypothetical protein
MYLVPTPTCYHRLSPVLSSSISELIPKSATGLIASTAEKVGIP